MATCTTSYGNTYEFSFEGQSNGTVRIYIDRQPSYGRRSDDGHDTHRNNDGSRKYICVREESQPRTPSEAKLVAEQWAMRTDRYIYSGVPLENPGRVSTRDDVPRAMSS